MRSFLPKYEMVVARTLADALTLLQPGSHDYKPFAGGTDLMVLLEAGKLDHPHYVSLWDCKELRGIHVTDASVTIGALTTYTDLLSSPAICSQYSLLAQAARETGSIAIQNRGTIGGNIANASPAADTPPALLAYRAELELVSATGARWVPYDGFHVAYKQTLLAPGEIIARIRVPRITDDWRFYYRKVGTRKAQAIAKVCMAAGVATESDVIRDAVIALGSVAAVPLRCKRTESVLIGRTLTPTVIDEARHALAEEIIPISDIRSTAEYRRRVAQNVLDEFLSSL